MEAVLANLEAAAQVIVAPPDIVSNEQRKSAEAIFLEFRRSKMPYNLCREILERSQADYVLFEAADLLKNAVIREWDLLQEQDRKSLRQYLLQYIIQKDRPAFVVERILQIIAIMIKRASIDDFGQERGLILTEIEGLILSGEISKQVLGCKLIQNLMQEYASTAKSTDVGLLWEVHSKAKKQFEVTELKRIFKFCIQALGELTKTDPPYTPNNVTVMRHLLCIAESVFSWGFITHMLPKRIICVFEAVYESEQSPSLRFSSTWRDVIFDPQFLPFMFSLYWKTQNEDQLAQHALTCLVQLASLNGAIFRFSDYRMEYLNAYVEGYIKLLRSVNLKPKHALGVANVVKKLVFFFPPGQLFGLPRDTLKLFLQCCSQMTCKFIEGAAAEEETSSDDTYYLDALEAMLESWTYLLKEVHDFDSVLLCYLESGVEEIFGTYLKFHLSAPTGCRRPGRGADDEINEVEEPDRLRYRDQLQTIGLLGRFVPGHSLPLLAKLLEEKTRALQVVLQQQPGRGLEDLHEDLHWLVLIAGHVLCMDSEGETPLIPSEIVEYSGRKLDKKESSAEVTMDLLTAFRDDLGNVKGAEALADHPVRLAVAVLRLAAVESAAVEAKLGHLLSPEVGCTIMWFLERWSLSYLLPKRAYYTVFCNLFVAVLGSESTGATLVINFLLDKIQFNLLNFHSEAALLQDTVKLFVSMVQCIYRVSHIVDSKSMWKVLELQDKLNAGLMPQSVRRGLFKGFVHVGASLTTSDNPAEYWNRLLKPVQDRFLAIVCSENFSRVYHEEKVRSELADVLESLIGVAEGSLASCSEELAQYMLPLLAQMPAVLGYYNNYQLLVQLLLELFCECTRLLFVFLDAETGRKAYELCLPLVQTYAKCNAQRLTADVTSKEDSYHDLLLVMELLTNIVTKWEPLGDGVAPPVEVCLYGVNFVLPLMTMELLNYPALCAQYYKMIMMVIEIYTDKVCGLPVDLRTKLLMSVELGLTAFSTDITTTCLDIVQCLATYLMNNQSEQAEVYASFMPFLKLVLDLILSHQISSDVMHIASTALFALICCYQDQYQMLVRSLIESQTDTTIAQRLLAAFTELMADVTLVQTRQQKIKFREEFDKFIVNVRGFLLVK